jgi:hypothetical protein
LEGEDGAEGERGGSGIFLTSRFHRNLIIVGCLIKREWGWGRGKEKEKGCKFKNCSLIKSLLSINF